MSTPPPPRPSFASSIGKRPRRIVDYMDSRVAELDDPRALGNVLTGPLEGLWRYRVGNCRVLCEIEDRVLRVLVVRIGHRREVYR